MASSSGVFSGGGAFLDSEAKDALVADQTPFAITDVQVDRDGQFGPECVYTILVDGDDESVQLSFAQDEGGARRSEAVRVAKALAVGDGSLEPVYLVEVQTRTGRTARALRGEPSEVAAKAKPKAASKRGAKPAAAATDDDIPF